MTNVENYFKELIEMTREFAASSIDDLYHSEEKREEARKLKEWYKNHPLKFEDLSLAQRRELGFGTWSEEAGECELIPLWVFRLLDPEQILVCPLFYPKMEIARVKNCDDDTRGGMVAYQFYRYPTEEELKMLDENKKVTKDMVGNIIHQDPGDHSEAKPTPPRVLLQLTSDAQLVADLTWNARRNTPKVDVRTVVDLTRNLAKFGFSEVTITLPGGLYVKDACRYAEELVDELEKKGFTSSWYDNLNGEDIDIHIDWSHLLKD